MKGLTIVFFVFCAFFVISNGAEDVDHNGVYIVYMGAASSVKGSLREDHAQLINSVLNRDKDAVLHVYKHGFSGFAARLTAEEADEIAQKPGVVYVFPSKTLKLDTTRSWDFLEHQNYGVIGKYPNLETDSFDGGDVIIGLLDSAIGSFHAIEKGILVVCSAGNTGPGSGTVKNYAPWIFSVAASTFDRAFQSNVVTGVGKVFTGLGINFSPLSKTPVYPLTHGVIAKKQNSDEKAARECELEALDQSLIEGKIVVCRMEKHCLLYQLSRKMKALGAIGVVAGCDHVGSEPPNSAAYPATIISLKEEAQISSYIDSTRKPVGTILATKIVMPYEPAPVIVNFSSRGLGLLRNIIKPDITAPGVTVLAAWLGNDSSIGLPGKQPPLYYILSGTSMSCPHVSGLAAAVKQRHPSWSSSAIRSAIMTTTICSGNNKTPIRTDEGGIATAYDMGAGEINPVAALDPGLVYETSTVDYLNLMCYDGFTIKQIKQIATELPAGFSCPKENQDLISNINYPSIAITKFSGSRTVTRTVTNVAEDDDKSPYKVQVESSHELAVKIVPNELQFDKNGQKLSYKVTFSATGSELSKDVFGSITWSNNKHKVRIPFMVSSDNGDGQTEAKGTTN